MKELKDIILKKDDMVEFADGNILCVFDTYAGIKAKELDEKMSKIILIKRPVKYETIYEAPKEILTKKEKEYLEAVIRPFRYRVIYVSKTYTNSTDEFIRMELNNDNCVLPYFKAGTMYKGMELDKEYTLKELGLFGGE